VEFPRDPGPLGSARVAAGSLPFGLKRGAELAGHRGEVRLQPPDLVPARHGQREGVVAVGHREGGPFQEAYPPHEAA